MIDRSAKVTTKLTSNTHLYQFSLLTSGSKNSGNSVQGHCKNASNDKKQHDFVSVQRVGKRLLHGTYRWGNFGSFLTLISHDSPVQTQKSPLFQRKKKWSNREINIPYITEMFFRQAENGQRKELKDSNKVIVID